MTKRSMTFAAFAALAVAWAASPASAQPIDTARIAAANPNDWLTYHGSYNSWNYSGLDQ
ncbi:MAG: alcohol dehydrogenase, partial [Methylobacteriaceae bacterium]|nr:alcohol dehydrogenase [Methylobacteriaceae bacterium]MBV9243403.1 alcohol dehydrogenase [Methylobacteriaceae bacterium]